MLVFPVILIAFLLILTGCSSNISGAIGQSNTNAAKTSRSGNSRQPDFGQPQREADIRGVVTSVVGNQVTVLKIALNSGRRASSTPNTTNSSSPTNSPSLSLNLGGGSLQGGAGRSGGPGGGFGSGARGGAADGQTDRAAMIANLKALSTGQETVTIPVGIKMMKFNVDASTKKREAVEASLTDVVADKMITVWLNPAVSDKKIADFVLIN